MQVYCGIEYIRKGRRAGEITTDKFLAIQPHDPAACHFIFPGSTQVTTQSTEKGGA